MKTVHNYYDKPCEKTDCDFIAYSEDCFKRHQNSFHGHGRKLDEYGKYSCPYSCKVAFRFQNSLEMHINIHKNKVMSCQYCQYRSTNLILLQTHLKIHFNIKNFSCDICQQNFVNNKKLLNHKFAVHNIDDYVCVDCDFTTTKLHAFHKHRISCEERLKRSRILWQHNYHNIATLQKIFF